MKSASVSGRYFEVEQPAINEYTETSMDKFNEAQLTFRQLVSSTPYYKPEPAALARLNFVSSNRNEPQHDLPPQHDPLL